MLHHNLFIALLFGSKKETVSCIDYTELEFRESYVSPALSANHLIRKKKKKTLCLF